MTSLAVIYDLDDTIVPTRSIPAATFKPVYDAINAANKQLSVTQLDTAFSELWRKPLDVVAREYSFSSEMVEACRNALINTDYSFTLFPFDDFAVIRKIAGLRLLVTTGITKLQQAKIDALFNEGDFDEIIIDDPYHDNRLGKKKIFAMVAERHELAANRVWIIGDNPESEIAAGNDLGMNTVQILRPGVERSGKANYIINSFHELKSLVES